MLTGHENMNTLQLVSLLEMYALLGQTHVPLPDLLATQEGALHVSQELQFRIKRTDRFVRELEKTYNGTSAKKSQSSNDLEKENKELELRDQEEGWILPDTSRL